MWVGKLFPVLSELKSSNSMQCIGQIMERERIMGRNSGGPVAL